MMLMPPSADFRRAIIDCLRRDDTMRFDDIAAYAAVIMLIFTFERLLLVFAALSLISPARFAISPRMLMRCAPEAIY